MARKHSGEIVTRTIRQRQKNGDIYVIERKTQYDPEKKCDDERAVILPYPLKNLSRRAEHLAAHRWIVNHTRGKKIP